MAMFTAALKRVYWTCDKIIVRTVRGTRYVPTGPNPGLDKRIQAFEKDGIQIADHDAEEFIEQSESDFYKVGGTYNEHLNETLIGKYKLQHQIVKEKYFKENMPNLLTWSEKEQIRHLHQEHPDEWTLEKLAESFPVTVPVLKKFLKYKWKPATEERITRHDASAMRNWKELKEGSLDIPKDLREHFLKFSNRTIPPLNPKSISKVEFIKEDNLGEFAKIVQRCAAQESSRTSNENNVDANAKKNESNGRMNSEKVKKDPKLMTLDELTEKIKKRLDKGEKVNVPDKLMVNTLNSKVESNNQNITSEIELSEGTEKVDQLTTFKEEDKGKNIMSYPERIRIPKKAYKKGATYKVNDCYYDHDGRFLYRVLGMSN